MIARNFTISSACTTSATHRPSDATAVKVSMLRVFMFSFPSLIGVELLLPFAPASRTRVNIQVRSQGIWLFLDTHGIIHLNEHEQKNYDRSGANHVGSTSGV